MFFIFLYFNPRLGSGETHRLRLRSFACMKRAIMSGICIVDTKVVYGLTFAFIFAFVFVFKCVNRLNCFEGGTKSENASAVSTTRS